MNPSSTSSQDPDDDKRSSGSRLDRELAEILSKTGSSLPQAPIPIEQYRRQRRPRGKPSYDWRAQLRQVTGVLTAVPILTALALGILCSMVADSSRLLAELLALAAVIVLIAPIVTHLRGGTQGTEPKIWRGQIMNSSPIQEHPIDQVKRWFRSRTPRR